MQKMWNKIAAFSILLALLAPVSLVAQKDKDDKDEKNEKDKKDVHQVIITRKKDKGEKVVIEINGDKVTVNGKPVDEYKEGDVTVRVNKLKDLESLSFMRTPRAGGTWNFNGNDNFNYNFNTHDVNEAMLGVTTEKGEQGAEITNITDESAAEKIGLKEGDIITKIGDKKIEGPDDLSKVIGEKKPGDKVEVTYLRDKKEMKATAELTKWKGVRAFGMGGDNFKMEIPDIDYKTIMPKIEGFRNMAPNIGHNWSWSGGSPKLGLSVQDTDDGKGVKVVEVDEESNAAKAGIKEDDIITQLDDKEIKNVDEISKLLREKKDNPTVRFQLTRGGKSQTIEVKMPKKIKTADL